MGRACGSDGGVVHQKPTNGKVAIEVLLEGPYASKSARWRLEREIELVGQLKHPNIMASSTPARSLRVASSG